MPYKKNKKCISRRNPTIPKNITPPQNKSVLDLFNEITTKYEEIKLCIPIPPIIEPDEYYNYKKLFQQAVNYKNRYLNEKKYRKIKRGRKIIENLYKTKLYKINFKLAQILDNLKAKNAGNKKNT